MTGIVRGVVQSRQAGKTGEVQQHRAQGHHAAGVEHAPGASSGRYGGSDA